ncbi:MAG TPA: ATPase [bacterium]
MIGDINLGKKKVVDTIKRCSKCVLPQTMPGIRFDEAGVCDYCRDYKKFEYKGEARFKKILDKHRDPNKKYECIVNVSGGRDSAFTLLKLAKDYGMKVLALNYENPYTDEQARKNIRNMVKALNVGLIKFKFMSNIHKSCFKNNLRAWQKNPSPAMVPMMCIGCKIIWKKILEIAKRHDINLIVNGGNPYEYTSFKKELLGVSESTDLEKSYSKNLTGLIREALKNYLYLKPQYLPVLVKGYLFANQYSIGSRLYGGHIERIDLFHYIRWDEKEVLSRIASELGWDYPHELRSTWRFDCKIGHLKDYFYTKTMGITEKDDFYAKMVREGILTREQALKRLSAENEIHMDIVRELSDRSG